jgi:hypothetical protein
MGAPTVRAAPCPFVAIAQFCRRWRPAPLAISTAGQPTLLDLLAEQMAHNGLTLLSHRYLATVVLTGFERLATVLTGLKIDGSATNRGENNDIIVAALFRPKPGFWKLLSVTNGHLARRRRSPKPCDMVCAQSIGAAPKVGRRSKW